MPEYTVEVHGRSRELYSVQATSAEEAEENWTTGHCVLLEVQDCEVYAVVEEDDD